MAHKSSLSQAEPVGTRRRAMPRAGILSFSDGALGLRIADRRLLLFIVDVLVLSGALLFSLWARTAIFAEMEGVGFFPLRPIWWIVLIMVWAPIALIFDCYNLRLASDLGRGLVYAIGCTLVVSAIYLIFPVYSAPLTRSRLAWFLFVATAVLGQGAWRLAYARIFRQAAFVRRALIVGAGLSGRSLGQEIANMGPHVGVEMVGYVDDNPALLNQVALAHYRVLGNGHDLAALVERLRVHDVVVAITNTHEIRPELMEALIGCGTQGVNVISMPTYYEQVTGAIPAQHLGQNVFILMSGQDNLGLRLWLVLRRLADLVVGLIGLVVTAALTPFIALAIVVESPGPVFYRQVRVGRGGRRFHLYKFRSMIPNAEQGGPVWATRNDPRKTRVGAFLRRVHLDELPQFWNLVNGTMTLIGPRPERPEFVEELTKALPCYALRHSVIPGLSGWAQVRYRYANSVDESLQKLCYDLYYIKRRGPALDALICLHTLRVLLRMQGS